MRTPYGYPTARRAAAHRAATARWILYYGALPSFGPVETGIFDVETLYGDLRPRLHAMVPAEERRPGAPWGTVSVRFQDGTSETYLFYEHEHARRAFRKACEHSVAPPKAARELYERVCAEVTEAAADAGKVPVQDLR